MLAALRKRDWQPAIPIAIFCTMWFAVTVIISLDKAPLLGVVIPYVFLFWFIAWKYPTVALMLVFSIAPFQNDLSRGGARFSLTEVHLALLFPVVLIQCYVHRREFHVGPTFIPAALYFCVCFFASIHHFQGQSTILSILQMLLYLIVVVGIFATYPRHAEQFRPALHGLIVICCCMAFYSLLTRNNFFWGLGKNGVGQALSCAVIVATELWFAAKNPKHKKLLGLALLLLAAGLVFSVSRGAWLGCFAALLMIGILRKQWAFMLKVAFLMIPIVAIAWTFLDAETQAYATSFDSTRFNISERYKFLDIAQKLWAESPIFGQGVGLRKQYDATNLVWSTLAETGVLGMVTFLAIHFVFFYMVYRTYRHLERDSLHFSIMLIGAGLVLRHFTHGMVDHYWSRGAVTLAWAGAGMAVYSYYVVKTEHRRRFLESHQHTDLRTTNRLRTLYGRRFRQPLPAPTQPTAADSTGVSGLSSPGRS